LDVGLLILRKIFDEMLNALKFLFFLPILWVGGASATSPCTGDRCIDEVSASFIAPYDFFEIRCSELSPKLRAQYSAVAAQFLRDADVSFLRKLRASKSYAVVRAKIESSANGLSVEELGKACERFASEPQGPTMQSTWTR
jgi:hypothetical protein